jgi:hypothetical protein
LDKQDAFLDRVRGFGRGPPGAGQVARAAHGSGGGGPSWSTTSKTIFSEGGICFIGHISARN